MVSEPSDVRSKDGVLEINLTAANAKESDGSTRYCFTDAEGRESPTLRVNPGDQVIIHLKNAMTDTDHAGYEAPHVHSSQTAACAGGMMMTVISTNLHFH
jgi:FtsP/CotA-like multicopper oxidase with cupredoxin domain